VISNLFVKCLWFFPEIEHETEWIAVVAVLAFAAHRISVRMVAHGGSERPTKRNFQA
jgi:hypothetical protein